MDRRDTIKWMLAASAVLPLRLRAAGTQSAGYGTDPDLHRTYHPGELWPLTLSGVQKQQAKLLCDTVLPGASAAGVVDFLDEWISAPYADQRTDRDVILRGLAWMEGEAGRRFAHPLVQLEISQLHAICDGICSVSRATPELMEAARFFARLRDLVVGAYYTTPQGRTELGYVGNVPLPRFDGPPVEVLKKAGLA